MRNKGVHRSSSKRPGQNPARRAQRQLEQLIARAVGQGDLQEGRRRLAALRKKLPPRPRAAPPRARAPDKPMNPVAAAGVAMSQLGETADRSMRHAVRTAGWSLKAASTVAGEVVTQVVSHSPMRGTPVEAVTRALVDRSVADQNFKVVVAVGLVNGVGSLVTGAATLAGGALQLTDAETRRRAGAAVQAVAENPVPVLTQLGSEVVAAATSQPDEFGGEVAANFVPVGALVSALAKLGRVGRLASAADDVTRGLHAGHAAALRRAEGLRPPPALSGAGSAVPEAAVAPSTVTAGARASIKKGYEWMPTTAPAAAGLPHATQRTAAALTAEQVKQGVLRGVVPENELAAIDDPNLFRFSLPAKQAGTIATQLRDTNAAMFGPMAHDVADRVAALRTRPLAELMADAPGVEARIKALPHAADGRLQTATRPESFDEGLEDLFGSHEGRFEQVQHLADSGASPTNSALFGETHLRAPVGEYGAELSRALVDAARIMVRESTAVSELVRGSQAYGAVAGTLVRAEELATTWREGIEGLCSSVALLTGKKVGGKSADEVLASLADGSILQQLASRAPLYGAEPLAGTGHISAKPLRIDSNGKVRLPENVVEFARDTLKAREEFSAEAQSAYARKHMRPEGPQRTETRRGCPLAARAPMYDAQGRLQMPDHSGIERISSAYIELVRRILRERQGSSGAVKG